MKNLAVVVLILLGGCASLRNVHYYPGPPLSSNELAVVAVHSRTGPVLREVDGKSFQNFKNEGLVNRVFLRPGTYEFTFRAIKNLNYRPTISVPGGPLIIGTSSFDVEFQKIKATVEAGHAYDFTNATDDHHNLVIRDLGTNFDIECLDPRYTLIPKINPMLDYERCSFYKNLE